jgi:hypothetical protein
MYDAELILPRKRDGFFAASLITRSESGTSPKTPF